MKRCYIMVVTETDGHLNIHRTNRGFNSFELMGLIENSLLDVRDQIQGKIKPDVITRKFIKDEGEATK